MNPLFKYYLKMNKLTWRGYLFFGIISIFIIPPGSITWNSGHGTAISGGLFIVLAGIIPHLRFNDKWDLSLPFSRSTFFLARLAVYYVVLILVLSAFFGMQLLIAISGSSNMFIADHPWVPLNLLLGAYTCIVFLLRWARNTGIESQHVSWKGVLLIILYIGFVFLVSFFAVFPPYNAAYIPTIAFIILGIIGTMMAYRSYQSYSLEDISLKKRKKKLKRQSESLFFSVTDSSIFRFLFGLTRYFFHQKACGCC